MSEQFTGRKVVKKFSSGLTTNGHAIDHAAIEGYTVGMKKTYLDKGAGLIVVTSGAGVAGRRRAEDIRGHEAMRRMTPQQQATIGATAMFGAWDMAWERLGVVSASIAVTDRQLFALSWRKRIFNRHEKLIFAGLLQDNFCSGIVTDANEADGINTAELFKENDGMGCHIGISAEADEYQMFTKHGGLRDEDGRLVGEINPDNIDWAYAIVAAREGSENGRGGFTAKIKAGWESAQAGIDSSIAAPNEDMTGDLITRFVVG
jgi:glutamate 5-kinase